MRFHIKRQRRSQRDRRGFSSTAQVQATELRRIKREYNDHNSSDKKRKKTIRFQPDGLLEFTIAVFHHHYQIKFKD